MSSFHSLKTPHHSIEPRTPYLLGFRGVAISSPILARFITMNHLLNLQLSFRNFSFTKLATVIEPHRTTLWSVPDPRAFAHADSPLGHQEFCQVHPDSFSFFIPLLQVAMGLLQHLNPDPSHIFIYLFSFHIYWVYCIKLSQLETLHCWPVLLLTLHSDKSYVFWGSPMKYFLWRVPLTTSSLSLSLLIGREVCSILCVFPLLI